MVTPLKGDSKLADAGIAHHRGDLEYGLGRSREELRGPGHALLQKILVDWDPINLAETQTNLYFQSMYLHLQFHLAF